MEWINVNELFPDEITKITNSLIPPNFVGDVGSVRRTQDNVKRVLDQLGEMSAQEQGLGRVITTAEKLRTADGHILYLLKDAEANSGAGEAVGLLKVGRKHLFLFNDEQTVREVEPLCVLDFYLKSTHQRKGMGKKLFDFMLKDQKTTVEKLAVDGPSATMKAFLAKNYNITRLIKQPNNFGISPKYFAEIPGNSRSMRPGAVPFAADSPAGRFTARHPPSTMASILRWDSTEECSGSKLPGGESKKSVVHGHANENAQDSEKCQRAVSSGAPTPAPSPQGAGGQAAAGLPTGEAQRPRSLAVAAAPPADHFTAPATPDATPSRRDSQLTDKGFFDVKFYHKKLW